MCVQFVLILSHLQHKDQQAPQNLAEECAKIHSKSRAQLAKHHLWFVAWTRVNIVRVHP